MCRSKAHGGRRCRGGKCAESRRARQRAYQARKRSERKQLEQHKSTSPLSTSLKSPITDSALRESDSLYVKHLFEDLESAADTDVSKWQKKQSRDNFRANRRLAVMEMMVREGRFDILDYELSDDDRARIQGMSAVEFQRMLGGVRDHLDVDTVVNDYGHSGTIGDDPGERTVRFIGELANIWLDGQTAAQLSAYRDDVAHFNGDGDQKTSFFDHSRRIAAARREAVSSALSELGTSAEVKASISTQKRKIGAHLREVSKLYPDAWKRSVDENCNELRIYASEARAHYKESAQVTHKAWHDNGTHTLLRGTFTEPTEVTLNPYFDGTTDRKDHVTVAVGGDPNNPEHVSSNNTAAETLNAKLSEMKLYVGGKKWYAQASESVRYEPVVTEDGTLGIKQQKFHAEGRESVIRTPEDDPSTLAHELAHRMEWGNEHIRALEARFLSRRAGDEEATSYHSDEQDFYADHFTNTYIGKVYNHGTREVLSVGMEMLFYGDNGAGVGAELPYDSYTRKGDDGRTVEDRDHLNFVLGLLFSARKSAPQGT